VGEVEEEGKCKGVEEDGRGRAAVTAPGIRVIYAFWGERMLSGGGSGCIDVKIDIRASSVGRWESGDNEALEARMG
jgi:hypothetical protein